MVKQPQPLGLLGSALSAFLIIFATPALSDRIENGACDVERGLEDAAFNQPMRFFSASNRGNMTTSSWIAAVGEITSDTPERFEEYLAAQTYVPNQIVFHSPGGNLAAGLELGRMIRAGEFTTNIGQTVRLANYSETPCRGWAETVWSGVCASSCAYAFLGGSTRFIDSPYYPNHGNLLGFHQFYNSQAHDPQGMLSSAEVAEIESSAYSVAQIVTGGIVLYAMDMGVDPRIVAFASSTGSDDLYFPTPADVEELSIATMQGLGEWFMEPYGPGLITAVRPRRESSLLQQVTAFCLTRSRQPRLLLTMDHANPYFETAEDLPLHGVNVILDGAEHWIGREALDVRMADRRITISAPADWLVPHIDRLTHIAFRLDAARVMGGFYEEGPLDETARRAVSLAWGNCI